MISAILKKNLRRFYHFGWAFLSILLYGRPSKKMVVIGVTGTDGKTTTTSFIYQILKKSGKKVAMINGLKFSLPSKDWPNKSDNSTPGRLTIRKFLKQAAKEGCEYVIFEATSWGMEQHRLYKVAFDVAVVTNFAHEHLDLHGSMQRYRAMKGKLFEALKSEHKAGQKKVIIVNQDDESASYFCRFKADQVISYGINKNADLKAVSIEQKDKLNFTLKLGGRLEDGISDSEGKSKNVSLALNGIFNISNALAAIGAALAVGIKLDTIITGLENVKKVPGRMEYINEGQGFYVVVDFAHTAQGFEAVFKSLRSQIGADKKIIAVYGSAGGRDTGRRKMVGQIAGEMADFSVLTSDDPRTENPQKIAEEIEEGLKEKGKKPEKDYIFIKDRAQAIAKGIKMAQTGDAVVMLSMGDYDIMYVGKGKVPWSDREAARKALN